MTVRVLSGWSDGEPWTAWSADLLGDACYRANFYTPQEPYERRRVMVTHKSMQADAERRERARGYVTFDELPEEAQRFWAESDANLLIYSVLRHLAGDDA